MTTENANLAHGHGILNLKTFRPYAKNPPIAKVFREIGLAEELGSGMRNSYKYTKLYSGGGPVFTEGDVFTTEIPLSEAATITVGGVRQDEIPAGMPSPENSIMENPTQSGNPTQTEAENPTQSGNPTQTEAENPTQSGNPTQTEAENPTQSTEKGDAAQGSEHDLKDIQLSEKEQALVDVLLNHPDYTQAQIAERMRRLIQNNVIEHTGSRHYGAWKVMIKG